jgi:O-antigen/teichoic acid export membrane protein
VAGAFREDTLAMLDQAVVSGANFAITLGIARWAGSAELGMYALAFSLLVFAGVAQESLVSLPYTIFGHRLDRDACAEYAGRTLLHQGMFSAFVVGLLGLLSTILWLGDFGPPGFGPVLHTLVAVSPFVLLREFCRRFAFAHFWVYSALLLDSTVAAAQLACLTALAATGRLSAMTACAASGLACGLMSIVWLVLAREHFVLRLRHAIPAAASARVFARWAFAGQLTSAAQAYSLHWLLAFRLGAELTGRFVACESVAALSNPVVLGMASSLTPRAARAWAREGRSGVRAVVWRGGILAGGLIGAFVLLLVAFGGDILRLLYGAELGDHRQAVIVLALGALVGVASAAIDSGLRALARPDVTFRASCLSLVVTVIGALWLLESRDVTGAAWAFLGGRVAALMARSVPFFRLTADA